MSTMLQDTTATYRNLKLITPLSTLYNSKKRGHKKVPNSQKINWWFVLLLPSKPGCTQHLHLWGRIRQFFNPVIKYFWWSQFDTQINGATKPADRHTNAIASLVSVEHRDPVVSGDARSADRQQHVAFLQAASFSR